jgi:hypothetical protein
MTPYEARSMRELAALRMVWASAGLDGGGDVVGRSDVVREEASGGAGLAVPRIVGGAGWPAGAGRHAPRRRNLSNWRTQSEAPANRGGFTE